MTEALLALKRPTICLANLGAVDQRSAFAILMQSIGQTQQTGPVSEIPILCRFFAGASSTGRERFPWTRRNGFIATDAQTQMFRTEMNTRIAHTQAVTPTVGGLQRHMIFV